MNLIFLLNTILGYLIALFYDVKKRNKDSRNSPGSFDLAFFWHDNKLRLLSSFGLSIFVMLALYFNVGDISGLFGKEWTELNNLVYLAVGAAPDLVIAFAKRKAGFLQPEATKGYQRK